jgi:hypothetical protein
LTQDIPKITSPNYYTSFTAYATHATENLHLLHLYLSILANLYKHCRAFFPKQILEWAIKIVERYVGKKNAKTYGEVNSGEG